MRLPLSKNQIGELGRRLIHAETPAAEDIAALNELLLVYSDLLLETVERVSTNLGLEPTYRTKTKDTILEKLARGGGRWLRDVQDLAGMRLVCDMSLIEQDALADRILELFSNAPKEARLIDRRHNPSHGYRTLHVIAYPYGIPVEIQLRTRLQHEWAETFERYADVVGRGVRYGEEPSHVVMHDGANERWLLAGRTETRVIEEESQAGVSRAAGDSLQNLSRLITQHEHRRCADDNRADIARAEAEIQWTLRSFQDGFASLVRALRGRYGG
ncbi:nucleotidyltransferase family protein [Allosalinactinospora lopnorensis]|uniref:hypothetical protein n=1 Tax=Allosalinactinospora lopnorensis TaxID=1352348 RepID=UPI000698BB4F|nr:hypothetical protein [Allosalinactinospora lopnorensis]